MGSALAKNYDVEKEATCSGGHCYLWQVFKATRKKDGKKVSVFYFNKADFEKRITQSLGSKRAKFVRDAVFEIMKKEVAALKALSKGADGASAPPGVLRLYEAIEESKKELAFVAERVLCSLGNAT